MRGAGERRGALVFLLVALLAMGLASLADPWAYVHLAYPRVYERDWGRMLRSVGYLPVWLAVGLAIALTDRPRPRWTRRGALLVAAAALSGIAAELLKLMVRRERPEAAGYAFRPWGDHPLDTHGLGFPSSHVMVAVGAAAMLSRLFPQASVVWYALAAGCALTRVLARAHYVSDVTGAAVLAYAIAFALWRWSLRRGGAEGPSPRG